MALCASMAEKPFGQDWLADFHGGTRPALEEFYREYYSTVDRSVGQVLHGADRETVVHEVFFRLLNGDEVRRQFHGGSPAAWIATVARNHAIDYRRRREREIPDGDTGNSADPSGSKLDEAANARLLIEQFSGRVLPVQWRPVFEACFVRQMTQREAARELGISRTTLLYQQHRVRALLRRFLLEAES
jgi:RNA polymerase sigma-70 factor, ECF subfamily